jgi:hypothetical protein
MTKDDAMKLALDALEQTLETLDNENSKPGGAIADTIWHSEHETLFDYLTSTIAALKERLAQEKALQALHSENERLGLYKDAYVEQEPPQRTWVGLTDKAITKVVDSMPRGIKGWMSDWDLYDYARAIETKLKENT